MITRSLSEEIRRMASWFPVVSVTGPRQSGKSTIVKSVFPEYAYVNLEDPLLRNAALDDPVGFIRNRPERLIVDEAQYAPDLFSMIQVVSDERGATGQYILSGSQNFLLMKRITQSLAGRVGILRLLPLSYAEVFAHDETVDADTFMFRGGFPRLYASNMPVGTFFNSYINTYIERDVSDYLDVRNLVSFRKFLELCALNTSNLTNYASIARDADVDARTAKAWLSILESSYVTFELMPYFANQSKRLIKTPKLYFYDTGLLCSLLGITSVEKLLLSPHLGAVFENLVVAETLKAYLNRNEEPRLFFYRDENKIEVDLMDFTDADNPRLVEIKSGQMYRDSYARHLTVVGDALGIERERRYVVARVASGYETKEASVRSAFDWLKS